MSDRLRVAVATAGPLEPWQQRSVERLRRVVEIAEDGAADLAVAFDPALAHSTGARLGALTFRFGEPPSALPIGWREVRDREATATCRLVLVTPDADRDVELRRAVIQTVAHSVAATAGRLLGCCVPWPAQLVEDLQRRGMEALRGEPVAEPPPAPVPGAAARLAGEASRLAGAARKARMMASEDRWNIGIVDKPAHAFLEDPSPIPVRWLPELLPLGYHADPFPLQRDGRMVLLAEGYDYHDRLGYLAMLDPEAPPGAMATRLDVPVPGHLSYPWPIERDGRLYVIPESHKARQVVLLRSEDPFPRRWEIEHVLLDGFAGVDCTPVEHDGRWWLFCADNDDQDQAKLYLFMADRLQGPWAPHPQNPVKIDCRSSRPGGRPFAHDGHLYRPTQDCSRVYGGAIAINRILELTPHRFVEEVAVRIEPDAKGPYPHGLHHFVPFGDRTVIDGNRRRFGPATALRWLRSRLRSR